MTAHPPWTSGALTPVRSLALVVGGVLAITSCQANPAAPGAQTAAAAGFYSLVTVNDTALPRTLRTATDYLLEITSDTIVLASDGRWADVTHYRETDGSTVTLIGNAISGTFDVDQGNVTFKSTGGGAFAGVLVDGTLTINLGSKAVYKK
ncbi:MAG: hypothetical protein ABIT20_14570 [Gemmatimonadaceae bacterium]